jgi:Transposase DDE domain
LKTLACKKKLHRYHPQPEPPVETHRTKKRTKPEPCDPTSLERGVRQLLADKVSGTMVGLWLLVPEHLRLGTWDLLCGWTGHPTPRLEPRVALQLVHEAALCVSGVRQQRTLSQKGFEVLNGLPFVVSDMAVHQLLGAHTVEEAQQLQVTLGLLRRASGHFFGNLLAIDPHRVRSYSKRQMRRHRKDNEAKPTKVAQTFFVLDADTHQPVCFTTGTASRTVAQATPELLDLAYRILKPDDHGPLVVADTEHLTTELFDDVHQRTRFDLLVPLAMHASLYHCLETIPAAQFTRQWAGYATTKQLYTPVKSQSGPFYQLIQRLGERPEEWTFKAFLCTTDRDEAQALTRDYPKRWHIEEFFNANQALGWQRAGTHNLHIRYAQMTMALIAQTVIHQLRSHLGEPMAGWDASHLAQSFFQGLDGDIRVTDDTIIVTYYNAPNVEQLRDHYENLPEKLLAQNVNPHIPWLYDFKLDFRFR